MKLKHIYQGRCPGAEGRMTLDPKCPACEASAEAWVCYVPEGWMMLPSLRSSREYSQGQAVTFAYPPNLTWKQLYRRGWRCRRVLVTPEEAVLS